MLLKRERERESNVDIAIGSTYSLIPTYSYFAPRQLLLEFWQLSFRQFRDKEKRSEEIVILTLFNGEKLKEGMKK